MVNENKVKMLTKLAAFEKKVYKNSDEIKKSGRKKYVAGGIWWTFVASTVAFVIVLLIWTIYKNNTLDIFTDFLNGKTYMFIRVRLWIEYIVFVGVFMIIALIVWNKRYTKLSGELDEYIKRRKNFEDYYNRKETQEP